MLKIHVSFRIHSRYRSGYIASGYVSDSETDPLPIPRRPCRRAATPHSAQASAHTRLHTRRAPEVLGHSSQTKHATSLLIHFIGGKALYPRRCRRAHRGDGLRDPRNSHARPSHHATVSVKSSRDPRTTLCGYDLALEEIHQRQAVSRVTRCGRSSVRSLLGAVVCCAAWQGTTRPTAASQKINLHALGHTSSSLGYTSGF